MAISRMQEPRQLYGLGSLVRKITRPIKKAVKGVTKIAKSPLGRTALLAAAGAYGLGALGGAGGTGFARFNPLAKGFFSKANLAQGLGTFFSKQNPLFFKEGAFNLGRAGLTASALGAALPFLAPGLLGPKEVEEEEIDIVNTPESIAALNQRARDFYNYGDENLTFMPQRQYVMRNFYAAKGGLADEEDDDKEFDRNLTGIMRMRKQKGGRVGFRIGSESGKDTSGRDYASDTAASRSVRTSPSRNTTSGGDDGGGDPPPQPTSGFKDDINKIGTAVGDFNLLKNIYELNPYGIGANIFGKLILDKFTEADTPEDELGGNLLADAFTTPTSGKFGLNLYDYNVLSKQGGFSDSQIKNLQLNPDINTKEIIRNIEGPIFTGKKGGSVRAPKKQGGLMDLGGLEMDFRAEGGFVPIGAKEKADDVPARLSKNEFVMTADAVRGAGKGSIKAGAQKMYNTMKELERRVV